MNGFFKLGRYDIAKGAIVAGLAVLLGALQQGLTDHAFAFEYYDWGTIFDVTWKAVGIYLTKNLLSNEEGKFMGRV